MGKIVLVSHELKYAKAMSALSSYSQVKDALGLSDEQTTVEGTRGFIEFILKEEKLGKQYSRCILNEKETLIGVITLKDIDPIKKTSHIGTWIGHEYWGQRYNELAKAAILAIAFNQFGLNYVFAGARADNYRSQKAQEKLPYITLRVEDEFPEELKMLEAQTGSKCVLNVFKKENYLAWRKAQEEIN
ncbi:GNAT family N-acetyltransferase [Sporosarcina ureilytica]|uniref:GNAT family N-acetyltransferase n=1 Tax=Sporosarcina ureilytica TaxID=298596 RepID=A0A1D8JE10_9BACL|nr:GNAT family N-acetyltransferase [Sporosarcina ureilytica]AOV06944.1 GNAT family N-acetyltransferase [Sporosarcina ureilytica]